MTDRRPLALGFGLAAFAVMALTQIGIPLADERAGPTVVVVLAATAASWAWASAAWGRGRATAALAATVAMTLAVEWVGTTTGWPFGRYRYTDALQPQVAGVPLVVPCAWFALGAPARDLAARLTDRPVLRVLVAAGALTAWDLFLDPQMVGEGYWRWADDGAYRGIPLTNYVGWFASAVVVLAVVDSLAGGARAPTSRPLLGLYTWWAVMETIGFVAFFGDPVVGVIGGVAMGVPTALAWRRVRRSGAGSTGGAAVAGDRARPRAPGLAGGRG